MVKKYAIPKADKAGFQTRGIKKVLPYKLLMVRENKINKRNSVKPATTAAPINPHFGITRRFKAMLKIAPDSAIFKTFPVLSADNKKYAINSLMIRRKNGTELG